MAEKENWKKKNQIYLKLKRIGQPANGRLLTRTPQNYAIDCNKLNWQFIVDRRFSKTKNCWSNFFLLVLQFSYETSTIMGYKRGTKKKKIEIKKQQQWIEMDFLIAGNCQQCLAPIEAFNLRSQQQWPMHCIVYNIHTFIVSLGIKLCELPMPTIDWCSTQQWMRFVLSSINPNGYRQTPRWFWNVLMQHSRKSIFPVLSQCTRLHFCKNKQNRKKMKKNVEKNRIFFSLWRSQ